MIIDLRVCDACGVAAVGPEDPREDVEGYAEFCFNVGWKGDSSDPDGGSYKWKTFHLCEKCHLKLQPEKVRELDRDSRQEAGREWFKKNLPNQDKIIKMIGRHIDKFRPRI